MNGLTIRYAEIDGIPICITESGAWCWRDYGHDGPHVLSAELDENGIAQNV